MPQVRNYSDANFPLSGEFRRFCCQKSHFRESSKSKDSLEGYRRGVRGAQCIFRLLI